MKPKIRDWPKWAKAAAKCSDGKWTWWDMVPEPREDYACSWYTDEAQVRIMHRSEVPEWEGDWRESLVVRDVSEGEVKPVKCVCGGEPLPPELLNPGLVMCALCECRTPFMRDNATAIRVWNAMQEAARKESEP